MSKFQIEKLSRVQKKLRLRLLELSYQKKLSHLGSCLSSLDIIEAVYKVKRKNDVFILSNGHAGYALYTVLEKHHLVNLDKKKNFSVHPSRREHQSIAVSSGSLGQGLPIATGLALAQPKQKVFCLISDGESTEGSIWEALRIIADTPVPNIMILVNANGWSAYDRVNVSKLQLRMKSFGFSFAACDGHLPELLEKHIKSFLISGTPQLLFCQTLVNQFSFLKDQDAHYHVMTQSEYEEVLEKLK